MEITVVSLFSGRWGSLSHYLYGLKNIDYPKEKLRLLWYCNCPTIFADTLRLVSKSLIGFKDIKIIHDQTLPPTQLCLSQMKDHKKGEQLNIAHRHLNNIASLYNAAWQYIDTDYVFTLEDDIILPHGTLKKFVNIIDEKPKAVELMGVFNDRHFEQAVMAFDLAQIPVVDKKGKVELVQVLVQPSCPWGVQKVVTGALGINLFIRSRMPKILKRKYPFKPVTKPKGMARPYGLDILLGLEITKNGGEVYADFETRPFHVDAKARYL